MSVLPNDGRYDARADWAKIGFAVASATVGDHAAGEQIWDAWCSKHPSYTADGTANVWRSATRGNHGVTGIGTLVNAVKAAGVEVPSHIRFNALSNEQEAAVDRLAAQIMGGAVKG
jgi:hypothetical protein